MKRYGLIGKSLAHSFSPSYFERKFKKLRLDDHSYTAYELANLSNLTSWIQEHQLDGFNVTLPFKEAILPLLDQVDDDAKTIGAVNCVKIKDGLTIGYNTDADGFKEALIEVLQGRTVERSLILGSGGASKAVAFALDRMNVSFKRVSRQGAISYECLTASEVREADLILNTTPLGMYPNVEAYPDIPYQAINRRHVVFDLIYNPTETAFLRKAKILGATTSNGLRMLELQAEGSWDIWNDHS